jgi:hypothetical protein
MIILLDEAEFLSKQDYQALEKYYKSGHLKSIIFVTHEPTELKTTPFIKEQIDENTFHFNLDVRRATKIAKERLEHPLLNEEVIKAIYKKDKRTRSFLKNCETYMRHVTKTRRKVGNTKDVEKILTTNTI